jgi:hypothetical protein
VKRRSILVLGLVVAAIALVPLATAGAEAPPTTSGEQAGPEGSVPPGGDVTCTTGATLTPDHGPPGTVVTVTTTFQGNCDDLAEVYFGAMTCSGQYLLQGHEAVPFEMSVDPVTGNATGSFTAPVTEPDPPVVDATEPITVTVTCFLPGQAVSPSAEGVPGPGISGTTYSYPPSNFTLELFADPDSQQPTLVENDDVVTTDGGGGVVAATPTFTG